MSARQSRVNIRIVIGIILIVVASVFILAILNSAQQKKVTVLVPKTEIGAFRELTASDLVEKAVADDATITDDTLTKKFFEQADGPLYTNTTLITGQLIPRGAVSADAVASYQIAAPGERVIGVTTDLPGSIAGTLRPGAIVQLVSADQSSALSGSSSEAYAKVICVGVGNSACKGVAGVDKPLNSDKDSSGSSNGDIILLVAMKNAAANTFAGETVKTVLNPFCEAKGDKIVPTDEANASECDFGGQE